jgi:hypothetical protein
MFGESTVHSREAGKSLLKLGLQFGARSDANHKFPECAFAPDQRIVIDAAIALVAANRSPHHACVTYGKIQSPRRGFWIASLRLQ